MMTAAPGTRLRRYSVRVVEDGGGRSSWLTVSAPTIGEALRGLRNGAYAGEVPLETEPPIRVDAIERIAC